MKTFISDIIPKIQKYSHKLDDLALLTNQHWVVVDEIKKIKNVYIFRKNNELLISTNGEVDKGKWEYLGNNSLLIDKNEKSYLFKHGFFDENVLALKIDGKDEYAFLINENRYDSELNSFSRVIEFINKKYLEPPALQTADTEYYLESSYKAKKTDETLLKEKTDLQSFYDKSFKSLVFWIIVIIELIILFAFIYTSNK
jgi:hypothetical protein